MYNTSLKHKQDNKKVPDYAVAQAEMKAKKEVEHKKAVEMADELKARKTPVDEIVDLTGLTKEEIESL